MIYTNPHITSITIYGEIVSVIAKTIDYPPGIGNAANFRRVSLSTCTDFQIGLKL